MVKAQWTMDSAIDEENYSNTLFRQEPGELRIPIDYDKLANDDQFLLS